MDQSEGRENISDLVKINGTATTLTLTAGGKLQWLEGGSNRCLTVEQEVLGFSTEGSRIKIRALVEKGGGICCIGGREIPVRKSFVFEPLSEASLQLWSQKLRDYIDSLGNKTMYLIILYI